MCSTVFNSFYCMKRKQPHGALALVPDIANTMVPDSLKMASAKLCTGRVLPEGQAPSFLKGGRDSEAEDHSSCYLKTLN